MRSIQDYKNPFRAIEDFESLLCQYTGAPYAVTTDCCTHAIEMVLRLNPPASAISFSAHTYLSVLMTMRQLGINYALVDEPWRGGYRFHGTNVWDCARQLDPGMYKSGQIQCISFGRTKPLEVGRGGCVLTDDPELAEKLSRMRYDGRDIITYSPWALQRDFDLGYHYYMRPEEAIVAMNKFDAGDFVPQTDDLYNYPDCRTINIR